MPENMFSLPYFSWASLFSKANMSMPSATCARSFGPHMQAHRGSHRGSQQRRVTTAEAHCSSHKGSHTVASRLFSRFLDPFPSSSHLEERGPVPAGRDDAPLLGQHAEDVKVLQHALGPPVPVQPMQVATCKR